MGIREKRNPPGSRVAAGPWVYPRDPWPCSNSGTNIEGELKDILAAVEQIHEVLHAEGSVRLISLLKLETRIDKTPTLAGKRL